MAKDKVTHYQILGLQTSVSNQEIKRAYRKLVKSVHPDVEYHQQSEKKRNAANLRMARLNEAYAVLMDRAKRADYDVEIGVTKRVTKIPVHGFDHADEEAQRERYLRHILYPARQSVQKILGRYKAELQELSQDIYDDALLANFEVYVNELESTLLKASQSLSSEPVPTSLTAALQWMRYCIAQAADGLDELRRFCQNFDYDHLYMADNLFKISLDHAKKVAQFIKIWRSA